MKLQNMDADIFIPDGKPMPAALERTTHLCIAAHQDDQEFMAYHGIAECFSRPDRWFSGVVVTDGGGSVREGLYAGISAESMTAVRRREQQKAAIIGEYGCQIQLGYSSAAVKSKRASQKEVTEDLTQILNTARPDVVYLHNPADKHDTHVAVFLRAIDALRNQPATSRPSFVYGCEVWRSLDWLCDADKTVQNLDKRPNIAASLSAVFDSQICAGKRYDLAVQGRRIANATFFDANHTDTSNALAWALDLTPLIHDPSLNISDFVFSFIDRFRSDVSERLQRFT